MLDRDGYPTQQTLDMIAAWPRDRQGGYLAMMELITSIWWPDGDEPHIRISDNQYVLVTSGWSGNEDIIGAMRANTMFWLFCWQMSERGGRYTFQMLESS